MGKARKYSEADQAAALALLQANDGNVLRTAKDAGVPESTLRKWAAGEGLSRDVALKCEEKKEALADLFERVSRAYLDRALEKSALAKTTGKDAVTASAIAADKMRLLREQPTEIVKGHVSIATATAEDVAEAERLLESAGAGDLHPDG